MTSKISSDATVPVTAPSVQFEVDRLLQAQFDLGQLSNFRGCPVIAIDAPIDDDLAKSLYLCLRTLGRVDRLHLVLSSGGGSISVARKVIHLLREYSSSYSVSLPFRAASAGTIICLGASDIGMGPMSEMSPIDPQIGSSQPSSGSSAVAAAEIKGFRSMTEGWFGLTRRRDRLRIVTSLSEQVFAPSLGSLYRAEQYTAQTAMLALRGQLPKANQKTLNRITSALATEQLAHDLPVTIVEAQGIGLRVSRLSEKEELHTWQLWEHCRQSLSPLHGLDLFDGAGVGLVLSNDYVALRRQLWATTSDGSRGEPFLRWERIGEAEQPNLTTLEENEAANE